MDHGRDASLDDAEDEATIGLLRAAGARAPVPPTRASRVRGAVHAHWRQGASRRTARRRMLQVGVSLAAIVTLGFLAWRFSTVEPARPVGSAAAVVERFDGQPRLVRDDGSVTGGLSREQVVREGEWIQTGAGGRVALRFADGTSVRIDAASLATPRSSAAVELASGAVYVDTGREEGRFEVRTALATARDRGTQFEVRLFDRAVRLRVRTGMVELDDRSRTISAGGGTELTLTSDGPVSRPIDVRGSNWDWAVGIAPPIGFDGRPLARFLEQIAREHGWTVHYADPELAREAAGVILHGSVDGLDPRDAVAVAVSASSLRHRLDGGELLVFR
jgi:hypothetical protein